MKRYTSGMTTTTIKVPSDLRDRLAERARRDNVTLAAAITKALDEAEDHAFWEQVNRDHAALNEHDREAFVRDATLTDDLDDAADDELSRQDAW